MLTPFSADAHYAAEMILQGRLRNMFWFGVVLLGTIGPGGLLVYALASDSLGLPIEVSAAALSLMGLLIFEKVWIVAGQAPPLS